MTDEQRFELWRAKLASAREAAMAAEAEAISHAVDVSTVLIDPDTGMAEILG